MRVRDNNGNTALHHAAHLGNFEVARILLECNAEVDSQNDEGSTPLHRAGRGIVSDPPFWWANEHPRIVQLLLDHGADARMRNLSVQTAYEVALGAERQDIAQLLAKHSVE